MANRQNIAMLKNVKSQLNVVTMNTKGTSNFFFIHSLDTK